jgi:hypothetical protein
MALRAATGHENPADRFPVLSSAFKDLTNPEPGTFQPTFFFRVKP